MSNYRVIRKVLYFIRNSDSAALEAELKMSEATHAETKRETFCQYCGGKLTSGYHFTCHVCGDAYCYIHMTRHRRAHARQASPEHVYAR